ncbi:MAG: hypothetical protein HW403_1385 [Dehalococcoidia bacterium]|nr:hypothetical protein [Dehalococcoidia bacterium]
MTRPAIFLVSGILFVNLLVFLLSVFLLPRVAPERRGGIRVNMHQPRRAAVEPWMEGRVREIVRAELHPNGDASEDMAISGRRGRELRRLLLPFGVLREVGGGVGLYLTSLVTFVSVCVGATFLVPARLRVVRDVISRDGHNAVRLGAIGLLGYLSIFVLCLMLAATVVGIPLAVLLLLVLAPVTVVGMAAVGLSLGRRLRRMARVDESSPVYDLLIGLLVLFPGGLIPYLGWIVAGISASLGFGAILVTKMGNRDSWSVKALEEKWE